MRDGLTDQVCHLAVGDAGGVDHQIVDNYHGLEHFESLIEALLTKADPRRFARRRHHWRNMLLADGVERIIRQARKEAAGTSRQEKKPSKRNLATSSTTSRGCNTAPCARRAC
jgi:hypothetical protein